MRARALRLAVAAIVLLALGLGTAVAGRSERAVPLAAERVAGTADRVSRVTGGVLTPLTGDEPLAVAGELTASVSLTRESGVRYARALTLRLASAAVALEGASVTVSGYMLTMDHGSFAVAAVPDDGGRYVAHLPIAMPGEWQLDVHIASGSGTGDLSLELDELD